MSDTIYGTSKGVAALSRQYASNRGDELDFSEETHPTINQLDNWMKQISSMIDTCLLTYGFVAPVLPEYEKAHDIVVSFVELMASTLVEGSNSFSRVAASGKSGWSLVKALKEINEYIKYWIEENAIGLEEGGLPRPNSDLATILVSTNDYETIFRRNQYNGVDTAS